MANVNRFANTRTARLPISDGDYVDVKERLSHGEREEMYARMSPDGFKLNRLETRTAMVLAYLVGWSFVDEAGAPVPFLPSMPLEERRSLICNLDPGTFDEVHKAIDAHEDRMIAERDALKKTKPGPGGAAPTSPSPSGAGGDTSGSGS